jgi:hypothetical protein
VIVAGDCLPTARPTIRSALPHAIGWAVLILPHDLYALDQIIKVGLDLVVVLVAEDVIDKAVAGEDAVVA